MRQVEDVTKFFSTLSRLHRKYVKLPEGALYIAIIHIFWKFVLILIAHISMSFSLQ